MNQLTKNKSTRSEQFLRRRKFLITLPFLVIPFLAMAFWSLGGGHGKQASSAADSTGFNSELPHAKLESNHAEDKLSYYNQALKDSTGATRNKLDFETRSMNAGSIAPLSEPDENEMIIAKKLEQINQEINRPEKPQPRSSSFPSRPEAGMTSDVDRLEALMNSMNGGNGNDPEMEQINAMMEKILDIQHPDRAREKIKEQSLKNKAGAYPVNAPAKSEVISHFATVSGDTARKVLSVKTNTSSGFFGLVEEAANAVGGNAIRAIVEQTQTVVTGGELKIRLLDEIYIAGVLIPKGQLVSGTVILNGERLIVEIPFVRYLNNIFPVALSAYNLDGLEGIYIPGTISRDAAKQGADNAVQELQMMTLDPSLSAQAVSAGIEAAKGLFSRKVKLIKVTVKAGYQILLKDSSTQNL